MAQDFSILLGAQVNTKTAQQQIDKIIKESSKRKINLEVGLNTDKSLSSFNKQMAQIENQLKTVTVKTREWTTAQGQLITQVEKIDSAGNTITQQLNQQSDAYGNLTQKVTTYYKRAGEYNAQQISQTEQLITRQQALRNAYDNAVNDYKNINTETNKYVNKLGEIVTRTTSVNEANQKTQTITKEYTDALGRLVTTSQEYVQVQGRFVPVGEKVVKVTNDEIARTKELDQTLSGVSSKFKDTSIHATTLGGKLADAASKVAFFKVTTTIVMSFYNAISEAKQAVLDYDAAMVEFNKVTPLTNSEINKMLDNFSKLSAEVGRTKTELVEIATEMSKSGFGTSTEEVTRMAELTALYQNTADEQLSAAEASQVLISQMRAFNYTADEAIHILDSINKVSAEFAVSSGDIGRGLTQAGAALQTYGNDFDDVVGLLTGASEIFIGRSQQVARG